MTSEELALQALELLESPLLPRASPPPAAAPGGDTALAPPLANGTATAVLETIARPGGPAALVPPATPATAAATKAPSVDSLALAATAPQEPLLDPPGPAATDSADDVALPAAPEGLVDAETLAAAIALERAGDVPRAPFPTATAASVAADAPRSAAAAERTVPLAELPRALEAAVGGFLRMRGHGRHWDAEIRLDPPELGALHVRLELRGHALHAVVRMDDPRLEPELDRMFQDLEEELRRQGGEASFEFDRGTHAGKEGPRPTPPAEARTRPADGAPARADRFAVSREAAPRADRLLDLLA